MISFIVCLAIAFSLIAYSPVIADIIVISVIIVLRYRYFINKLRFIPNPRRVCTGQQQDQDDAKHPQPSDRALHPRHHALMRCVRNHRCIIVHFRTSCYTRSTGRSQRHETFAFCEGMPQFQCEKHLLAVMLLSGHIISHHPLISAPHVFSPTSPSTSRPLAFWNAFTAASVLAPKSPSSVSL